ncbi:MAG: NTP transferase domain-containing protein, partial [Candidatus Bathyarchaeota archaeon]|nr:NTP transferase domain-containing protein [Candidatus Bathyarchaeota archaeon]
IVALIMAGGKGTRFGGDTEKPMAIFQGKPLIRIVIDATKESKKIAETYVAVTSISPKTAQEAKKASVTVVETDSKGYHADLQQAVKEAKIDCPVLIVSSDLPLLTGTFIDEVIEKYEKAGKPALTVMIPEEAFQEFGLSAVSLYEHDKKMYAVSGINILDGARISEEQDQLVVVSKRPEAVFNVNSIKDLDAINDYLLRNKTE